MATAFSPPPTAVTASPPSNHRLIRLPVSYSTSTTPISISPLRFKSTRFAPLVRPRPIWNSTVSATVDEEVRAETVTASLEAEEAGEGRGEVKFQVKPCELYVCNLPRSCGESELLNLFKPFGSVKNVELSKNSETGISKGCGYVTMSSIGEAKTAIAGLDGSDLDGREIRVKYSADMVPLRKAIIPQSFSDKVETFESQYQIYAGNLSWSVTADNLREHFSQFGNVTNLILQHDRKGGQNRTYAFISFSTADELEAALSSSGTEFLGRTMVVREIIKS